MWYCLPDSLSLFVYNPETASRVTLAALGTVFQTDNKTTKQLNNKTTKQPDNKTTKQLNNQTTKQPFSQATTVAWLIC